MVLHASSQPVWSVYTPSRGELHLLSGNPPKLRRALLLRDRKDQALTILSVLESRARRSLLVRFRQPVLWEIFLAPNAPPVYEGLVHDFRMGEGLQEPANFPVRQIELGAAAGLMLAVEDSPNVIFTTGGPGRDWTIVLFNLDVRRGIAHIQLADRPVGLAQRCAGSERIIVVSFEKAPAAALRLPDLADWRIKQEANASCDPG